MHLLSVYYIGNTLHTSSLNFSMLLTGCETILQMRKLRFILGNNLAIVIAYMLQVIDSASLVMKSVDLLEIDGNESLVM